MRIIGVAIPSPRTSHADGPDRCRDGRLRAEARQPRTRRRPDPERSSVCRAASARSDDSGSGTARPARGASRVGRLARARATRTRRARATADACDRLRRRACNVETRRRDRVARARACHQRLPGLGDAALRPLLPASGPRVRATRDAVSNHARRVRRCVGRRTDGALSTCTAVVSGRAHVLPDARREARRRRASLATGPRRLHARDASGVAGRVQRSRRPDRPLSDGCSAAVPSRSLR